MVLSWLNNNTRPKKREREKIRKKDYNRAKEQTKDFFLYLQMIVIQELEVSFLFSKQMQLVIISLFEKKEKIVVVVVVVGNNNNNVLFNQLILI